MTTWHSLQPQTTNHKGFTEREGVSSGSGVFQLFEVLLQTDGASFIFLLQHNLVCKLLLSKWTDLRSSICLRLQSRVQSDWFPALSGPPDPDLGRCIWRRAPWTFVSNCRGEIGAPRNCREEGLLGTEPMTFLHQFFHCAARQWGASGKRWVEVRTDLKVQTLFEGTL